jgi:hypothetical protein
MQDALTAPGAGVPPGTREPNAAFQRKLRSFSLDIVISSDET